MARCGWCGSSKLDADRHPDNPQRHSIPVGGTSCKGMSTYRTTTAVVVRDWYAPREKR